MKINLEGVQKTLLIPLWCRAKLSKENKPIISDSKAINIVNNIEYDFTNIDENIPYFTKLMLVTRAKAIDDIIKQFISIHPNAIIINLGAGLDTAFSRIDNKKIKWYDIDLPKVIEIRNQLIPESKRSKYISGSIFNMEWVMEIPKSKDSILFISGGVLPYFKEKIIKKFFIKIINHFPGSEIIFDTQSTLGNVISNIGMYFSGEKSATLCWGIKNAIKIEKWDDHIRLIKQFPLFLNLNRDLLSKEIRKMINLSDKLRFANIVHLRFNE